MSQHMSRVILASGNVNKLRELRALLRPLGIDVVDQPALDITGAAETAETFIENALLKARHASREAGLAAIADDSGLVVDALNGAPGIRSARFAGEQASDADNNAALMTALAGVPKPRAHFYCAVVFLRHPADPAPLVSTAAWHGHIVKEPRGDNGFGYDPHFYVESLGSTAAELEPQVKNQVSHRGQALRHLCEQMRQLS